jgi:hypothetical protein
MYELMPADFPLARSNDLVAETIGAETVVYDGVTKEAHCLAALAAAVFAASDGRTSVADLAAIATAKLGEPVDVPAVEFALAELEDRDLIEKRQSDGMSRRSLLRRGALAGGAALAAPLVVSLVTPEYGAASSLSSLSYVVVVFLGSDGKYYRVKKEQGGYVFGWGPATPGNGCTYPEPANSSDNTVAGAVFTESAGSGTTNVTISWSNTGPITWSLVDVRIKCAGDCHNPSLQSTSCGASTCSSGPYTGC